MHNPYAEMMKVEKDTRRVRETSFGYMIHRLARQSDARMAQGLQALGLTLPQFPIMMTVLERAPLTQAEIGKIYDRPAYVISRALDGLEELGLIERHPHPTSRRAHQITASPAGKDMAPRLYQLIQDTNAENLSPLSEDERATLLSLLPRLLET